MPNAIARSLKLIVPALALGLAAGLLTAPASHAEPGADLNTVQGQVRDLQHEAEASSERYNEAKDTLKDVSAQLNAIRDKVAKQKAEQEASQRSVEALARTLYMTGSIDPTLQVILTDDPAAFLAQASAMDHLAQSQQDILRQWRTSNLRLLQAEAQLADREAEARRLKKSMGDAATEAGAKLKAAEGLLGQLSAADRERLARIREQKRQQEIAEARQAAGGTAGGGNSGNGNSGNGNSGNGNSGNGNSGGGGDKPSSAGGYSASGRAATVVNFALQQVGKRYRAARTGLDSYDCSGLVLAAYRKVGVSLTHYSRAQFSQTKRVPMSQMRPGDLVFYFGRGAHHVAIYVGKGKMVSASNPDDGVELINFLGPWYRERFSGVGRVLN